MSDMLNIEGIEEPSTPNGSTTSHDNQPNGQSDFVSNGVPNGHAQEPQRRRSSRARTSTVFFVSEPIVPRSKPKKLKKKPSSKDGIHKSEVKSKHSKYTKHTKHNKHNKHSKHEEVKVVPPPTFVRVKSEYPEDIIWQRLTLREFFIRFQMLIRLPNRHFSTIDDPTCEWNEYLYKSVIVSIFKIIFNDLVPVVNYSKEYMMEIEKTPADSDRIWQLLAEYLIYASLKSNSASTMNGHANGNVEKTEEEIEEEQLLTAKKNSQYVRLSELTEEFAQERQRLSYVVELLLLATTSETIRYTIQEDQEEARKIHSEAQEEIKKLKTGWEDQLEKLNKTRPEKPNLLSKWQDRFNSMKQASNDRIRQVEVSSFIRQKRFNSGNLCLGSDNLGNRYWIFQRKSDDNSSHWGSWIVCEKNEHLIHPAGKYYVPQSEVEEAKTIIGQNRNNRLYYIASKQQILKLVTWLKSQQSKSKPAPPPPVKTELDDNKENDKEPGKSKPRQSAMSLLIKRLTRFAEFCSQQ